MKLFFRKKLLLAIAIAVSSLAFHPTQSLAGPEEEIEAALAIIFQTITRIEIDSARARGLGEKKAPLAISNQDPATLSAQLAIINNHIESVSTVPENIEWISSLYSLLDSATDRKKALQFAPLRGAIVDIFSKMATSTNTGLNSTGSRLLESLRDNKTNSKAERAEITEIMISAGQPPTSQGLLAAYEAIERFATIHTESLRPEAKIYSVFSLDKLRCTLSDIAQDWISDASTIPANLTQNLLTIYEGSSSFQIVELQQGTREVDDVIRAIRANIINIAYDLSKNRRIRGGVELLTQLQNSKTNSKPERKAIGIDLDNAHGFISSENNHFANAVEGLTEIIAALEQDAVTIPNGYVEGDRKYADMMRHLTYLESAIPNVTQIPSVDFQYVFEYCVSIGILDLNRALGIATALANNANTKNEGFEALTFLVNYDVGENFNFSNRMKAAKELHDLYEPAVTLGVISELVLSKDLYYPVDTGTTFLALRRLVLRGVGLGYLADILKSINSNPSLSSNPGLTAIRKNIARRLYQFILDPNIDANISEKALGILDPRFISDKEVRRLQARFAGRATIIRNETSFLVDSNSLSRFEGLRIGDQVYTTVQFEDQSADAAKAAAVTRKARSRGRGTTAKSTPETDTTAAAGAGASTETTPGFSISTITQGDTKTTVATIRLDIPTDEGGATTFSSLVGVEFSELFRRTYLERRTGTDVGTDDGTGAFIPSDTSNRQKFEFPGVNNKHDVLGILLSSPDSTVRSFAHEALRSEAVSLIRKKLDSNSGSAAANDPRWTDMMSFVEYSPVLSLSLGYFVVVIEQKAATYDSAHTSHDDSYPKLLQLRELFLKALAASKGHYEDILLYSYNDKDKSDAALPFVMSLKTDFSNSLVGANYRSSSTLPIAPINPRALEAIVALTISGEEEIRGRASKALELLCDNAHKLLFGESIVPLIGNTSPLTLESRLIAVAALLKIPTIRSLEILMATLDEFNNSPGILVRNEANAELKRRGLVTLITETIRDFIELHRSGEKKELSAKVNRFLNEKVAQFLERNKNAPLSLRPKEAAAIVQFNSQIDSLLADIKTWSAGDSSLGSKQEVVTPRTSDSAIRDIIWLGDDVAPAKVTKQPARSFWSTLFGGMKAKSVRNLNIISANIDSTASVKNTSLPVTAELTEGDIGGATSTFISESNGGTPKDTATTTDSPATRELPTNPVGRWTRLINMARNLRTLLIPNISSPVRQIVDGPATTDGATSTEASPATAVNLKDHNFISANKDDPNFANPTVHRPTRVATTKGKTFILGEDMTLRMDDASTPKFYAGLLSWPNPPRITDIASNGSDVVAFAEDGRIYKYNWEKGYFKEIAKARGNPLVTYRTGVAAVDEANMARGSRFNPDEILAISETKVSVRYHEVLAFIPLTKGIDISHLGNEADIFRTVLKEDPLQVAQQTAADAPAVEPPAGRTPEQRAAVKITTGVIELDVDARFDSTSEHNSPVTPTDQQPAPTQPADIKATAAEIIERSGKVTLPPSDTVSARAGTGTRVEERTADVQEQVAQGKGKTGVPGPGGVEGTGTNKANEGKTGRGRRGGGTNFH